LSWPKFCLHDSSPCVIHCLPRTFPSLLAQIYYALAAQSSTNVNLFFIALTLLPGKMIFFFIRHTTYSYLQNSFFFNLTFTNALYVAFTAKIIIIIIIIITPIYILQLIH